MTEALLPAPVACAHAWRFDARVDAGAAPWLGCEQPTRLRCQVPGCGAVEHMRCDSSRSRACQACAALYRARVGVVAGSGFRVSEVGLFVTLTAPGTRPHYVGGSRHLCPCTPPGGVDLRRWNAEAGTAFNRFVQQLRRHLGYKVEYFKATEVQERGALHFHLLLRAPAGGVVVLSETTLRRLAMAHGFGHEVDVQPFAREQAGYVAKYVSKSADARPDVPWWGWRRARSTLDAVTGELVPPPVRKVRSTRASFRTWSSSRDFGDPMALVRRAQQHWRMVVDALPSWDHGESPDVAVWGDVASVPAAARYGNPLPLAPDGSGSPP